MNMNDIMIEIIGTQESISSSIIIFHSSSCAC